MREILHSQQHINALQMVAITLRAARPVHCAELFSLQCIEWPNEPAGSSFRKTVVLLF